MVPWLLWLSGFSAGLRTKGSLVGFLVGAHAWVAGQFPGGWHMRGHHTLMSLPVFLLPLTLSLKINKIFKKIKTW